MSADPPIRKLNVLEAREAKHCLCQIGQPKIRFVPPDYRGEPYHDVVVVPVSHDLEALAGLDQLPSLAWKPARFGRGKVVFDASMEGYPHSEARTRALHGALDRVGVPRAQAVYVTQDRGYGEHYRAWCKASGDGPPMKVVVFDYWVREVAQQHLSRGAEEFEARLRAYRTRPRRRPRRFLSLNRTLRETKVLFLLRMMRDGAWDQGAISLGGFDGLPEHKRHPPRMVAHRLTQVEGLGELGDELAPLLPRLHELGEITFESGRRDPRFGLVMDEPLAQYGETWFSVVTETEMASRPCRITEKPLKALMNFHPLIVLGNPGALGFLRDYGFQTYPALFDESYDDEPDPRRRFEKVVGEVERLCRMDEAELDRLERQTEDAAIANARHGLIELPWRFHTHLNRALVEAILAPAADGADALICTAPVAAPPPERRAAPTAPAARRELVVYQPHAGRCCLRGLADPGVVWTEDPARAGEALITVLPASHDLAFMERLDEIPESAWSAARSGRGRLVFDASQEGWPHQPGRTAALHGFLERVGVSRAQAIYVTQDRAYAADYAAHCAATGEGPPMKVLPFDFWVWALAGQHGRRGEKLFKERLAAFQARPRRREARLLTLNRTLRSTKALFLLRLIQEGLMDQALVSLGGLDIQRRGKGWSDEKIEKRLLGAPGFEDLNRELRPLLPRLVDMGEVTFRTARANQKFGPVLDDPLEEYGRAWFSVITETEMLDRPCRITEKPLKSLMNFHPFIVLGNPGSLAMLKDYGFASYPELFDEAYDEEPDPRRRFELVFDQVTRLCRMDEAELERLERRVEETVIANAHNGLVGLPRLFRDRLEPALVEAILAPAEIAAA